MRIPPAMPVTSYQTYAIIRPRETHIRTADCMEAGCLAHRQGWVTEIDENTDLGQRQAHYIRRQAGRGYTEEKRHGLTRFHFYAGQECFATHEIAVERDPIHLVRGGDWRGNPTGYRYAYDRGDQWVDDFASHQDNLERSLNG